MCDCFHMVLPTWPGTPGSVSGRQLQPEDPDAETEEDHSVTEGPVDEIIRPRPQGSSPVYECVTEGPGFELLEDTSDRQGSSGRRRSWWKRGSGDSRTFSRMSHPEEATDVTLKTEVEAGASGYSVTGGGDQGIFVKHVLKDSSAAKLFSLREGDQLLSATIFFDDIKYEDALKILQYSEPYKVQFKVRRKVPTRVDVDRDARGAQQAPKPTEKQGKDITDGGTATPTKTMESNGDQERLIAKARDGRGRRPQKDRLSWPKFQAIKSKGGRGPRRSHSSSEAYERGKVPAVGPTSSDTEAEFPPDEQEQEAGTGSQRRSRFLNLKFKVGSGKGPSLAGQPGTGSQSEAVHSRVLEEAGSWDATQEATWAATHGTKDDRTAEAQQGTPALSVQWPTEPALSYEADLGGGSDMAARPQRKTTERQVQEETVTQGKPRAGRVPKQGRGCTKVGIKVLDMETATLPLQDRTGEGHTQGHQADVQIQILNLKTPKFGFSKQKVLGTEGSMAVLEQGPRQGRSATKIVTKGDKSPDTNKDRDLAVRRPKRDKGRAERSLATMKGGDTIGWDQNVEGKEEKMKILKFKLPSLGWSQGKDAKSVTETQKREIERENQRHTFLKEVNLELDLESSDEDEGKEQRVPSKIKEEQETEKGKESEISPGDKEMASRDSKFKMPKFKMPSFGGSAPSKDLGTSVDVPVPKITGEATLPCLSGEIQAPEGSVQHPSAEIELPEAEGEVRLGKLKGKAEGARFKGHMPTVQMPSLKMPKVDIKGPQVDITTPKLDLKGAKGEVAAPDMGVSLPSVEVDIQAPGAKLEGDMLEGDMALGDKEMAARESKFKMPKFKMPSFGGSAPSKDLGKFVDVPVPKITGEATLPCLSVEMQAPEGSVQLPSAEIELPRAEVEVALPEGEVRLGELKGKAEGARFKGHMPTVQMPSLKMPKVDIKGPQVDITRPKLHLKGTKGEVATPDVGVSLPSIGLDIQAAGARLEGDMALEDNEMAAKDSKFKMPKFKMPSFGMAVPSKSSDASVEVSGQQVQADVRLPSIQTDVKTCDLSIDLPSADVDVKTGELELKLPEVHVPEAELQERDARTGLKRHLPTVHMPSMEMPKLDFKGPQVDITGPKLDLKGAKGEVAAPDVGVSLPSVEVDIQAPGTKLEVDMALGDKELTARDSKFKMPKFKMPSFGGSAPSKDLGTSVDVPVPKSRGEVTLPCLSGEMQAPEGSVQLPSTEIELPRAEVEVALPEGEVKLGELKGKAEGARFKGHMPTVPMPSLKMPKVDIKGPQVDITGPKLHLKGAKGEVAIPDMGVSLPSIGLDIQEAGARLEGDMALEDKEMAARDSKFKMPKFKMPSFGMAVSSKSSDASVEVSGPQVQADVCLPSIQTDVETCDLSINLPSADVDVKTSELGVKLPEVQVPEAELQERDARTGLKGHMPTVQMPSIKMPKVDFKGPQVDITGPKLDLKGAKGEVTATGMGVSLPSMEVDIQAPDAKLEGDVALEDKQMAARDSKFKMPKFKMPSFGMAVPSKSSDASVEVSGQQVQADVRLPSIQIDIKTCDLSINLPSADVDVKTSELGVKLPEVQVPEAELQERDARTGLKGHMPMVHMPSMEIPKVDFKGPQVDITGPKLDLKGAKGEVAAPDVVVSLPSVEVDIQAPGTKLEVDMALGDKEVTARDSKFKMPKFKMPKGDFKGPQVDITGPKLDVKGAKGEVAAPDMGLSLPSVEVDIQAPGARLEGDMALEDKEMAAKDSKFKMPKFRMPSFGGSAPSKDLGTSVDVPVPKITGEATLPCLSGEMQAPEDSVQLPSAEIELPGAEGEVRLGELKSKAEGARFKGHMPTVQMPSLKMPKVDIKGPQVDITGPKLDLKGAKGELATPDVGVLLPSVEEDIQAPGARLESDMALEDKELAARESKFKMPKFKMPSFGMAVPSKSIDASVEVSGPQVQADVCLPSIQTDVKTCDLSIDLPSADLDVKTGELGVKLPEGHAPDAELQERDARTGLKGHMPKVQMPSIKMPKGDFKGPQVDITGPKLDLKGAKCEVTAPDMGVLLPSVEVDIQAPGARLEGAKLEGDMALEDKEMAARDSKFKMPKFKMPSFGGSAPSKDLGTSVDVPVPKITGEATLPCLSGEMQAPEGSVQLPSAEIELPGAEGEVRLGELKGKAEGARFKGHMPTVQMPSLKMPKVDIKGPQVDITGPKLDLKGAKGELATPDVGVLLPSVEEDIQAPGARLESDMALEDKELAARESKFKMPKFKMPSFGMAVPSKSIDASVEVSGPQVQADVCLPSIQTDVKTCDLSIDLPSADLDVKTGELGVKLPEGHAPDAELQERDARTGLKGHMPKVQMPSIKMPKGDFKGPQVDITGPKLDLKGAKSEVTAPDMGVLLPSVEVDIQAPGARLEGDVALGEKEVTARDSKFKMPKVDFKGPQVDITGPKLDLKGAKGEVAAPDVVVSLPSVEVDIQAPGTKLEVDMALGDKEVTARDSKFKMPKFKMPKGDFKGPQVDITGPKLDVKGAKGEVAAPNVVVSLPSVEVDIQAPGTKLEVDMALGDKEVTARDSKFKMPKFKMPKGDFKGPQVDITGPKLDVKGAKGEVAAPDMGLSLPSVEVDIQAPGAKLEGDMALEDKEMAARDSKFKMPKFRMPSFGGSAPSKDLGTSVDVPVPKITGEATLPCLSGEMQAPEVSVQLPSAEIELPGAEGEVRLGELKGKAEGARFKGHMPTVQMPSLKMPKVDIKGPQVDITGPKLDLKGAKGELATPDVGVLLPSVEEDIQAPGARLESDMALEDKELAARESKFKMPKFKMPSFGMAVPSKSIDASVEVSGPQVQADVCLPSIQTDVKTCDLSIDLPSADLDVKTGELGVKLPEGHAPDAELQERDARTGLKGHMPKVQMPSIKMPKGDFKGPQVDITGPKLDLKGAKCEVTAPDMGVLLPSVEVDIQAPGARLEGDVALGEKEVTARDSKFKMPKVDFKGPQVDITGPKLDLKGAKGEVAAPDVVVSLPSVEVDIQAPGTKLEVDMALGDKEVTARDSKFKMPKFKMPKGDFKGPQVDITGPKLDVKGAKGEVAAPNVVVSLPSVEVDIQAPGTKLEVDMALEDKEMTARDSKFKMPKFKMPSFGGSAPSKDLGTSVDVPVPKITGEATLPCLSGEMQAPEVSVQLPSAEIELPGAEGEVRLGELKGKAEAARFKSHMPKVQMPSMEMPKGHFKGPQMDITGPKLDLKGAKGEVAALDVGVSLPSVEVDIQAPGARLEGDMALGDKEMAARDSKFKMPKFKMPSFGISAPSKDLGTSVDVPVPKTKGEATLPCLSGEMQAPEVSVQLPSAEIELPGAEGEVRLGELKGKAEGARFKGHMPTVPMPSLKMPKVDIKGPQVDITGPKLGLKGVKGELATPDVGVLLPSVEVDIQAPGARLEGDMALEDKEMDTRESKFKMPKFKMPSFSMAMPSKSIDASVEVSGPQVQADVRLPSIQTNVKTCDLSIDLPSADVDVKTGKMGVKLPEVHVPEAELQECDTRTGLKGHLPTVHMPSMEMPKGDFKGPQVDITGPKLDLKGAKGEVTAPSMTVTLPSVGLDIQVPGTNLEGDIVLGDKVVTARESKFKMRKFKMPKVDFKGPQVDLTGPELDLKGDKGEVTAPDVGVSLPSVEVDIQAPGAKLEGDMALGDKEMASRDSKFKMPKFKMPKVDFKGPQVDIMGPKLDMKGAKGEVTAPDVGVSLPSVEVDIQAPGTKLEGDMALGDKEMAARDSKFKMPKFKMPSFGGSAPSKDLGTSVDVPVPKITGDATLPCLSGEMQATEGSVQLPSAEIQLPRAEVEVALPEGEVRLGELKGKAEGARFKGHMPTVQMPSLKMSKVDIKGPQVDITGPKLDLKGAKGEVAAPDVGVSLPSVEVDIQAPGARLEGDMVLKDKEMPARDSKFKMPKFKMPSFGMAVPSKTIDASVDVSGPQVQADVRLPSIQTDVKTCDLSIDLPSADMDVKTGEMGVKLPEVHVPEGELQERDTRTGLKGHLPTVYMRSMEMPKVDFKGPQVDITGPKLDLKGAKGEVTAPGMTVTLPSVGLDIQVPGTNLEGARLEGDMALEDKEMPARDSKFKMPKFKMPSFGGSAPSKDLETSVDVPVPRITGEATLPCLSGEMQAPEGSVQLPSAEIELPGTEVEVALPEGEVMLGELKGKAEGARFKGHMPTVQMPSLKMPKVDIKGPQVDITGPKVDLKGAKGEVAAPDMGVSLPSMEVDIQAPGAKLEGEMALGDKEVSARDSKLKMPKFKMPKVDFKGPQVDITGPKLDLKGAKGEVATPDVGVSLPSVEVDIQAPGARLEGDMALEDKEMPARDSKFKMPKFKMPSFGMVVPSKSSDASVEVSGPQVQADVRLPSIQTEVKTCDLSIDLPSDDLNVKTGELGVKLPEVQVPEAELQERDARTGLKGHLPTLKMPKFKMPKVDFKGPQVDITGPKLDLKGAKGEVAAPDVGVSLPSVEVDIQAPGTKLEVDMALGDKEVSARDSKFKMPKFRMPSFGGSAPSKDLGTSVDVPVPKITGEATLPCLSGEMQAPEVSVQLPSAEIELPGAEGEVRLGELKGKAEGARFKGHMPTVPMPSFKMPKVDIKGPQVDITGPKLDLKGAKGEVAAPDVGVSLPSVEVDIQAPGARLEGDMALGDKEMPPRGSKFKMPKFKMPSFGMLAPNKSSDASVEVSGPQVPEDVHLPSIQTDVKTCDLSIDLPFADMDVKTGELGLKLPEGLAPEAELQERDARTGLKGHLPMVHMASMEMPKVDFKGPQVDITGPKLDLKGAKGEVTTPNVGVSLPSVEVDIQAPGVRLEGDMALGDKELSSRSIAWKMPKGSVSFPYSSNQASVVSSQVQGSDQTLEGTYSLELMDPSVSVGDISVSTVDLDEGLSIERGGEKSKVKKFRFKMPKVFSPPGKSPKSLGGFHADSGVSLPGSRLATPLELGGGGSLGECETFREPSMQVPGLGWSSAPLGSVDLSGPHAESSTLPSCEGVTPSKYQVTLPGATVSPVLPPGTLSESQGDAHLSNKECTADLSSWERLPLSQSDSHPGAVDPSVYTSYGQVTFPKFHRPKFVFSAPEAGDVEGALRAVGGALSPPSPVWGVSSSAEEVMVFPRPGTQLPSAGVSMSEVTEDPVGTARTAGMTPGGDPAEDADCDGKGSPLKMPQLRLPSFRRSPKKEMDPKEYPAHTLVVDVRPKGTLPGLPVSQMEAYLDRERGRVKTPGFALPKLAGPKRRASMGGTGLPQGDLDPSLSSSPAEGASQATVRASGEGGVRGTGAMVGPPEGAGVDLHLPRVHLPSVSFVHPDFRPTELQEEVSQSAGEVLPKHSLSLGDGSKGHGLGDGSASQPRGQVMDPSTEDPLQASSRTTDTAAPTVGSAEGDAAVGDAAVGDARVGSQESWFRMPSLRLPGFWRSSRDRGVTQVPAPAISTPKQGEAQATVKSQGVHVPGSEVEAAVSPQPPEAEADMAHVLRRTLDSKSLNVHLSPAGMSAGDLPTSEVQLHPGQDSLSLQMPSGRLSETKAPPGEVSKTPARGSERAEHRSSPTEGPLRLKASRTDVPSQISIVDMGQFWEDSVLTVKFPTLKVPRFTFPAPDSTADVFIPAVREVWCPDSSLDLALHEESPGVWDASILKAGAGVPREPPVVLDPSLEASPISKVRVHIQGTWVESQEVTIQSRVTAEFADLSEPQAFSTQIVRESEIPASEIQMPSYGFSLLKGKVPERPSQAQVPMVTEDSGPPEALQEAPQEVTPGANPASGDHQPDSVEPFEMISSSVNMLGPQTFTFEVRSGHQFADSYSDEEPAEILEFPPEDVQEAAAPLEDEGREAKEKPESKRSGLFRFWLPNIGFSSSAQETSAGTTEDVPRPAPVQAQPEVHSGVELPKKQEKAGWFRFPKLGFSSSPTKKSQSTEDKVGLAEPQLQEEAVTFFDAQESFFPEEKEDRKPAEAVATGPGPRAMVTSAAKRELVVLEQGQKSQ
ncbi:protein AHNAK2 [Rhinolophus ferrumequinum]|uniref:protein AHNAK2 n=1 Tax=Rhinolophus ferrumequinum TaxID=59479 RepID=UPI00140F5C47|nr:protein AHNAK2 [Rhinolophus ferrumequinum]